MIEYTAKDKLREVRRELALRKRLYQRWVANGQMKADDARNRYAIMEAIERDYEELCARDELPLGKNLTAGPPDH